MSQFSFWVISQGATLLITWFWYVMVEVPLWDLRMHLYQLHAYKCWESALISLVNHRTAIIDRLSIIIGYADIFLYSQLKKNLVMHSPCSLALSLIWYVAIVVPFKDKLMKLLYFLNSIEKAEYSFFPRPVGNNLSTLINHD